MASSLFANLDEAVKRKLKRRAERHGPLMERRSATFCVMPSRMRVVAEKGPRHCDCGAISRDRARGANQEFKGYTSSLSSSMNDHSRYQCRLSTDASSSRTLVAASWLDRPGATSIWTTP